MKQIFEKLNIQYETLEIPPPFCYKLKIDCLPQTGNLQINFSQEYINREEVEEEEILAEGFSGNDDFQWQGSLPEIWLSQLEKQVDELILSKENTSIQLQLFMPSGKQKGSPPDIEKWTYLIQELTQAILEKSKKELPLQMGIMQIDEQKRENIQWLEFSFVHCSIKDEKGMPVLNWHKGRELMRLIYMLDFEEPSTVSKNNPGIYIDPGDGYWYRLGKGAKNPHPENDVQSKIEDKVTQLMMK